MSETEASIPPESGDDEYHPDSDADVADDDHLLDMDEDISATGTNQDETEQKEDAVETDSEFWVYLIFS